MPSTRTVDVHVAWLRQKIEDKPTAPETHPHGPRPGLQVRGLNGCTALRLSGGSAEAPVLWARLAPGRHVPRTPTGLARRKCRAQAQDSGLSCTLPPGTLLAHRVRAGHGNHKGSLGVGGGASASWPGRQGPSWRPTSARRRRARSPPSKPWNPLSGLRSRPRRRWPTDLLATRPASCSCAAGSGAPAGRRQQPPSAGQRQALDIGTRAGARRRRGEGRWPGASDRPGCPGAGAARRSRARRRGGGRAAAATRIWCCRRSR